MNATSWVGPYLPNEPKMADGGHLEFREMLIYPQRIQISAPNVVYRYSFNMYITIIKHSDHDVHATSAKQQLTTVSLSCRRGYHAGLR